MNCACQAELLHREKSCGQGQAEGAEDALHAIDHHYCSVLQCSVPQCIYSVVNYTVLHCDVLHYCSSTTLCYTVVFYTTIVIE